MIELNVKVKAKGKVGYLGLRRPLGEEMAGLCQDLIGLALPISKEV